MSLALGSRIRGRAWPSPPAEAEYDAQGFVRLRPPKHGRVHLGCGDRYLRGYLNVDLPPNEGVASGTSRPDLESDVTKVRCPTGVLAEIRLHHLFEHFARTDALALLLRWHLWLRPGGVLCIETPDFDGCVAHFAKRSPAEQGIVIRHIFGSQEAPWAQHLDGWSASRFRLVLGELGFTGISTAQTFSDQRRLLPNVVVKAHRANDGGPTHEQQATKALGILRQSMNGNAASEESLFERWRAQFETRCSEDSGAIAGRQSI